MELDALWEATATIILSPQPILALQATQEALEAPEVPAVVVEAVAVEEYHTPATWIGPVENGLNAMVLGKCSCHVSRKNAK